MRNFHLIARQVNIVPLLHAIARQPKLWNQHTLRTEHKGSVHKEVDDIWLRFNEISEDESKVINDKECINYPAMKVLPQVRSILFDLMRLVEGERLGRVIISRMAPGARIYPHADGGAPAEYYDRYQIPLQSFPGVVFRAGDEQVEMAAGDIWWFDNEKEHEVLNNSRDDRISMIVDIRTMRDDYKPR